MENTDSIIKDVMLFRRFDVTNAAEVYEYLKDCPYISSDYSMGYLFMWQKELNIHYAITKDTLVLRFDLDGQATFSFPYGEYRDEVLKELVRYVKENKMPLRFYGVSKEQLPLFNNCPFFRDVNMSYDEKWSDYVYDFKEVLSFSGKKYSGQRNHINRYRSLYGEAKVMDIDDADITKVMDMLHEYEFEHPDPNALEREEYALSIELIKNYKALKQHGIVLLNDKDEVIGVAVGEILHDTLYIHVEKALRSYKGIYPTLYQSFVRHVNERYTELSYVNREDDSGDEGLRTSKNQYQPIARIHKYVIHVNSPISRVDWHVLEGEKVCLTRFMDRDIKAYHDLNIDKENNKYWGYDYTEDLSITELNEHVFYDNAIADMAIGSSINLAVREKGKDEMIGEVILWNFTYEDDAELGCRIMKGYQGRGYGKEAFSLAYEYATKELGLRVWSRCYKENVPSREMIEASGMTLDREDDTFYYFK